MTCFLLIIVSVCIVIILVDALPQFYSWQSRIHIGRIRTRYQWQEKVLHCSIKWLSNAPTEPFTDNTREIFIGVAKRN